MATKLPRDRFGRPLPAGSRDELSHAAEPARVSASAREARLRGVELFDEQRFFEAHEFFEFAWNAADPSDADRDFLRALAQVAVGCCHIQRDNRRGARAVLTRAAGLLTPYPTPHRGVDTEALVDLIGSLCRPLRGRTPTEEIPFPKFPAT